MSRPDVSGYLLDELGPAERRAFERALVEDPGLRREVDRLRPLVGRLEALDPAAWRPAEPPPLEIPDSPRRRRRAFGPRPALALACALALLLAVGIALSRDGAPDRRLIPVGEARAATGEARVASDGVRVHVSGLPRSDGDGFYELWLLNSRTDLVSLGSFRVPASGETEVSVPVPADPAGYEFLDVSAEPADGDPAHSGRSVLRATLG